MKVVFLGSQVDNEIEMASDEARPDSSHIKSRAIDVCLIQYCAIRAIGLRGVNKAVETDLSNKKTGSDACVIVSEAGVTPKNMELERR